jgi:hypothetical protein
MAQQIIPLDSNPGQTWTATGSINGGLVTIGAALNFNEIAGYWVISIYDSSGNLLLDSLPLVTGLNILAQFRYLGIGSMFVLNASGVTTPNYPNSTDLGSDFVLLWQDTSDVVGVAY